jgi:hypothetical protein
VREEIHVEGRNRHVQLTVKTRSCLCARDFVNKVGRALHGLRFADANRISADRARGIGVYVPRSESIGTLDYMGLFRYYCVLLTVNIKLPVFLPR